MKPHHILETATLTCVRLNSIDLVYLASKGKQVARLIQLNVKYIFQLYGQTSFRLTNCLKCFQKALLITFLEVFPNMR